MAQDGSLLYGRAALGAVPNSARCTCEQSVETVSAAHCLSGSVLGGDGPVQKQPGPPAITRRRLVPVPQCTAVPAGVKDEPTSGDYMTDVSLDRPHVSAISALYYANSVWPSLGTA